MRKYLFPIVFLSTFLTFPTMAQHPAEHSQTPPHVPLDAKIELVFPAGRQVVEVPFRLDHSKIVVPVQVNGSEPLSFVLDTGANLAFLVDGQRVRNTDFKILGEAHLQGAGHGSEIRTVGVAGEVTFALGGVELRGNRMAIGTGGTGILAGTGWDGIFGRQVFENLVVEIDWEAEVLRLHDPAEYTVPPGASSIPLTFERGHAFVQADLAVEGDSTVPVKVVIDTGASHALSLATGKGGFSPPSRHIEDALLGRGLSGEIHGAVGRIDRIRLGDFVLNDVVTTFPEESLVPIITSQSDGNLGSEILRRFNTTFDYARERMVLEANGHLAEPFEFSTAGFRMHVHVGLCIFHHQARL